MPETHIGKEFLVSAIYFDEIYITDSVTNEHAVGIVVPYYVLENAEHKKTEADYLEGHNSCGLKVGDTVKIIRKAEDGESGWGEVWDKEMDDWVGMLAEVTGDYQTSGFKVEDCGFYSYWFFPYFCLEKVED